MLLNVKDDILLMEKSQLSLCSYPFYHKHYLFIFIVFAFKYSTASLLFLHCFNLLLFVLCLVVAVLCLGTNRFQTLFLNIERFAVRPRFLCETPDRPKSLVFKFGFWDSGSRKVKGQQT